MLFTILFLSPTLLLIMWSLWQRRVTWACRFERCATITLVLMALGVTFTSPSVKPLIAPTMNDFTGFWNLGDVIGDGFLVLAAAGIGYLAVERILWKEEARKFLRRWVDLPAAAGITSALFCFSMSGGPDFPDSLAELPMPPWVSAYVILVACTVGYLLAFACWPLSIMVREHRHRRIAMLYMGTCAAGVLACVITAIDVSIGRTLTTRAIAVDMSAFVWLGGFAIAAACSWRRRLLDLGLTQKRKKRKDPTLV
jgi:hypothetical protein